MFLLECPRCHKRMKYAPVGGVSDLSGKKKACVYCNLSFGVQKAVVRPV